MILCQIALAVGASYAWAQYTSTAVLSRGFAIRNDTQAKRIRANPTPIRTCSLANPSTNARLSWSPTKFWTTLDMDRGQHKSIRLSGNNVTYEWSVQYQGCCHRLHWAPSSQQVTSVCNSPTALCAKHAQRYSVTIASVDYGTYWRNACQIEPTYIEARTLQERVVSKVSTKNNRNLLMLKSLINSLMFFTPPFGSRGKRTSVN